MKDSFPLSKEFPDQAPPSCDRNIAFANYANQARHRYSDISINEIVQSFYEDHPQFINDEIKLDNIKSE